MNCSDPEEPVQRFLLAGGKTTVFVENSNSFQFPAPNLNPNELEKHRLGDQAFEASFVTAPSTVNSGLGPLFNQNSCGGCHPKNGRSNFPDSQFDLAGLLFRLSITGKGPHGEPLSVPGFGGQLQTKAIFGKIPEAQVAITTKLISGTFSDGEVYELSQAEFSLINTYQALPADLMTSARIAPPVFGLGLLEHVDENTILRNQDIHDDNQDGISGKANSVWNEELQTMQIGRFGWKAGQPNLIQQTAAAYKEDMGITNPIFKTESSKNQSQEDSLSDDPEIDLNLVELTAFYTQSLGVPAPRNQQDPIVNKGRQVFLNAGCGSCHIPNLKTGEQPLNSFLNNQEIQAYTDLLLHDMGPGLADHRPEFLANGQEWRTPPLWGIGLSLLVNGHTHFLHDGRARNVQEAILWHDGEAKKAVDTFKSLSKADRKALLQFLQSL